MSATSLTVLAAIIGSALFLPDIAFPQATENPKGQPSVEAIPVRKTIDRHELKRLIAEKLAEKADPEVIQLLLDQARSGEKRSLDRLANRESFEKLLVEMEELKAITAQVRKDTVGDLVDQSPTEPIEIVVNQTINRLKARIGGDPRGEPVGIDARFGQPIPEYADTPLLLEKVNNLRKSQMALRQYLAKKASGSDEAEKNQLIQAMLLAQEELAWEAAWPYTEGEVTLITEAKGKIPDEVCLSRLKRGVEALNNTVASERASVGRGTPARQFVLYRPVNPEAAKLIEARLLDLRGSASAWRELAVPFDSEAENLLSMPEGRSD